MVSGWKNLLDMPARYPQMGVRAVSPRGGIPLTFFCSWAAFLPLIAPHGPMPPKWPLKSDVLVFKSAEYGIWLEKCA